MIATSIGGVFLREVPKHLASGVDDGTLQLFGSVLRNVSTGQIAGFLQEAGPIAKIMANPLLGLAQVGLETGHIVQGELLRQGLGRIENSVASLTQLGSINLALSAAGIGVSIAGFAVLAQRIGRVQQSVDSVAEKIDLIDTKVDQIRQDLINVDLAELKALARSLDEAWSFDNMERAERQWHDVAKGALSQQSRFEMRAEHLLRVDPNFILAEAMSDALAFANSLRVTAFAACNESRAAHEAAADGARTIERLTGGIGLADLVRASLAQVSAELGTPDWESALMAAKNEAGPQVLRMRQREAAIATRTAPFVSLEASGISPRDLLNAARTATEVPILLLPNDSAA